MKKSTNLILLYNVHQDKEPVDRNSERKKLTTLEEMFLARKILIYRYCTVHNLVGGGVGYTF